MIEEILGPAPQRETHLKDFPTPWFLSAMFINTTLAMMGGYVNALCFAGLYHTGLTHLTGLTTNTAIRVIIPASPGGITGFQYFVYVFTFFLGCVTTGAILEKSRFRWGGLQAICLAIESISLYGAWHFVGSTFGACCITYAMGVQNGISSSFQPMVIRSTHITGTVVDIGLTIGQIARTQSLANLWKLRIHVPMYAVFWSGALLGAFVYNRHLHHALFVPCTIAGAYALVTFAYVVYEKNVLQKPEYIGVGDYEDIPLFKGGGGGANSHTLSVAEYDSSGTHTTRPGAAAAAPPPLYDSSGSFNSKRY